MDVFSFSILFSFSVVYCGPTEWRFERRRGSSCDRKNTVRHLIQMMSISESNHEDETEEDSDENLNQDIPDEFIDLYKDEELRKTLVSSLPDRDANSPAIFIPRGFGNRVLSFFIPRGLRNLKPIPQGPRGIFGE